MISTLEKEITFRFLKARKKDGFLNVISIFSFIGISLGVAILIIVMSVMNGFKTELTNKILGLNPHIVIQSNGFNIDYRYISKIEIIFKNPSFFLGLRFLNEINLSVLVNKVSILKFRFYVL